MPDGLGTSPGDRGSNALLAVLGDPAFEERAATAARAPVMQVPVTVCADNAIVRVVSGAVPEDLPPSPPGVRLIVQFNTPLAADEHRRLGALLADRPEVALRAYDGPGMPDDLGFLEHYRCLGHLQIDLLRLRSLDGLRALPDTLSTLAIGETVARALSLGVLERFAGLEELYLDGQRKDIEVIGRLLNLRRLTLRGITLPDLSALRPLRNLQEFELKLGGTRNLAFLPEIGRLRHLEIYRVRQLHDLSFLAGLRELQRLHLEALGGVAALPSLAPLTRLRRVVLATMKGVTDLAPVAAAPALEDLGLVEMPHLRLEHLAPLVGHPRLRCAIMGLGSLKRNAAAMALLGVRNDFRWPFAYV